MVQISDEAIVPLKRALQKIADEAGMSESEALDFEDDVLDYIDEK